MNDMKTMNIKSTDYRVQITESGSVPGSVLAAIRKASVLCTLCSVLLISSCTHDEIIPPTPLAPQGTKTVTVDFQLPEGKPGFGEVETRATTTDASWADGDELLMKIIVKGFDDTDSYAVYESYMMLAYDDSDDDSGGYWNMLEDKSTTVLEVASSFVANPDYVMLAQTTDIDLTQPLSIKVPEDMSLDMTIVSVTYAPDLEWDITPDANGAVTDIKRKLKATATTTAPECWEVSSGEWSTNQARLRVNTGAAGDVVTITSENFYPNSIEESADGIYTATTDADGNAYFYGEAGSYDDSDRITATTSGFNLSLTAVTVGEGNAAFTYHIAPVTLLEASTLVPVQLVGGLSCCLDATEKRTAVPNTIAKIDGASTDLATVKTNIEQLLAAGKTTLVVTGKALAPYSNENSEKEAKTVVGEAIRQLETSTTFSIVLPDATSIGEKAFNGCTALTIVSLPAAETIGDYAFYACTALTIVSLPAATTIGYSAFNGCDALTSVSLPAATTIGDSAFNGCDALTSVSLPAATTIGEQAFDDCALTSVSLPVAITIGDYAFQYCTALQSVSLPAATTIGNSAFSRCTALTSVSLPVAITIGESAFFGCDALKSLSLPAATSIGNYAFQQCTDLTSLTFGSVIESVGYLAFSSVNENKWTLNCDLTLAAGQMVMEGENMTWADMIWKSITLVDSN